MVVGRMHPSGNEPRSEGLVPPSRPEGLFLVHSDTLTFCKTPRPQLDSGHYGGWSSMRMPSGNRRAGPRHSWEPGSPDRRRVASSLAQQGVRTQRAAIKTTGRWVDGCLTVAPRRPACKGRAKAPMDGLAQCRCHQHPDERFFAQDRQNGRAQPQSPRGLGTSNTGGPSRPALSSRVRPRRRRRRGRSDGRSLLVCGTERTAAPMVGCMSRVVLHARAAVETQKTGLSISRIPMRHHGKNTWKNTMSHRRIGLLGPRGAYKL